ncbi:response regulator [Leifsonia poae]|uniref:DNA-binding response regulator n=1 Tax=Leifsonia poae TaxID=110933 RepID=A0A9W6H989_9MICO|nr:response regulator transcription factor [Leifsonia poae]GLJ76249.1 DNA-binding response regulator [Leifsonia poae]
MIRLVIADDHPVVRAGLRALLDHEDGLTVVGEASTPDEAVALAERENPDVVLMDLQFGPAAGGTGTGAGASGTVATGADATRRIRALDAPPYVLVLTNYDTDGDILGAVEAGASGYLLKDAPPRELIAAVRAAASGESALAPAIAGRLLDRMRSPQVSLSRREIEVLSLVAAGRSNSEIAADLVVSETTVKSHLVHIFSKLDVGSRTAAVSVARDLGILRP